MHNTPPDTAQVIVLPPLAYGAAFIMGLLVHVPTKADAFPKPLVFSLTETCHPYIMGNPQKDDQLKQWNRHITPPTQRS